MPLGVDPSLNFEVRQDDLADVQWGEPRDDTGLGEGQVDVAIRRFALTANNITYACLGNRIPRAVRDHLGPSLRTTIAAGFTHGSDVSEALLGPRCELFMAPAHMQRLHDLRGKDVYWQRFTQAWQRFHALIAQGTAFVPTTGPAGVERVYREMLAGKVPDATAHLLSIR